VNAPTPIEQQIIAEGAKHVAEIAKGIFKGFGFFAKRAVELGKIELAAIRYCERYAERHGHIKVLGMSQPVPLRQVYTSVKCVSSDFLYAFSTPEELEKLFRASDITSFFLQQEDKREGFAVANQTQFLNLLGQPGAGKSTFLRRVGLEALSPRPLIGKSKNLYDHRCLPVFIELKSLKFSDVDLRQIIQEEFTNCGFPDSPRFTDHALKNGDLLLLLDGLDEVPSEKVDEAIVHIQDFVDRYGKNRFITSCRTAFYKSFFRRFSDVVLTDFDRQQIETFITNWFQSQLDVERKTAEELWTLLQQSTHRPTLELARTPLLLTFLCLVYDRKQSLPANRSSLYRKALEILLEEWAGQKRIARDPIYKGLNPDLETLMLARIAGPAFAENRFFFRREDLVLVIRDYLRQELQAPPELDATKVLTAIEVQQGLLVQRAHDIYSFSHLTLQEYLTALYYKEYELIASLVEDHLFDARWREVFLLIAGMRRTEGLLDAMVTRIDRFALGNDKVSRVAGWAARVVRNSDDPVQLAARRAAAMFILIDFARVLIVEATRHDADDPIYLKHARAELRDLTFDLAPELSLAVTGDLQTSLIGKDIGFNDKVIYKIDVESATHNLQRIVKLCESLDFLDADWGRIRQAILDFRNVNIKTEHESLLSEFKRCLLSIIRHFRATPDMAEFSAAEVEQFGTYVTAIRLVVQTRSAALSLEQRNWNNLVSRLLMVT
jgi:hypothetical protein